MRTRRFDTLTYARSASEAEDITLFDRKRRRNIALYSSAQKVARNGRFYNEDDLADYDILDYDINADVTPDREWIEGRTIVWLKIRAFGVGAITMHLADSLVVRSIVSPQFGRLFGIRVKNQNTIVINFPAMQTRDTVLSLTIAYAGRLPPQAADRETIGVAGEPGQRGVAQDDVPTVLPEPSFLYSSRSFCTRKARSPTTRPRRCGSPCRRRSTASPAARSPPARRCCCPAASRPTCASCTSSAPRSRSGISRC